MTYNSPYDEYEELYEHVPAGVASAYRAFEPYPMIIERADGPYVHDVDGDRYIDYDLNNGAGMVSHDHPAVTGSLCLNAASFPTPHHVSQQWTISIQHEDEHIERHLEAFKDVAPMLADRQESEHDSIGVFCAFEPRSRRFAISSPSSRHLDF